MGFSFPPWKRPKSSLGSSHARSRGLLILLCYLAAFLFIGLWTVYPSLQPLTAVAKIQDLEKQVKKSGNLSNLSLKQMIQAHFRKHGAHVEFEDIFIASDAVRNPQSPEYFLTKTCGDGKIYLFLAFPYRLPLNGEKIFEWCLIL